VTAAPEKRRRPIRPAPIALERRKTTEPSKPAKLSNPSNLGAVRLHVLLAHAGVASRRRAEQMIRAGEVTVNGHVVK
jgi:23S rRNA pseudouridine2605 synthase